MPDCYMEGCNEKTPSANRRRRQSSDALSDAYEVSWRAWGWKSSIRHKTGTRPNWLGPPHPSNRDGSRLLYGADHTLFTPAVKYSLQTENLL